MKFLWPCGLTIVAMFLQPGAYGSPTSDKAGQTTSDAARQGIEQRLDTGRRLLKEDNLEATERLLEKAQPEGMPAADLHQLIAADLLRIGFAAKDAGDIAAAQKAGLAALRHLDKAERLLEADEDATANLLSMKGFIKEYLTGDTTQALEEYKKALNKSPQTEQARKKVQSAERTR